MSKIAFQPNVSGTGTFTIAAPNSNTDRTFTLPDAGGEVLTDQRLASETEAEAGTDNTRLMTPLRTKQAIEELAGGGNPAGTIIFHAADTAPEGFLKANGAAVSRTTYADLFAAIGTTFGSGDGSTTFNLPDLRGEFPRGWDDGRGVDTGRSFGTAQLDQMQRITGLAESRRGVIRADQSFRSSGAFSWTSTSFGDGMPQTQSGSRRALSFNSANSPNARVSSTTSGETRSRNVALLACIKF